MRNILEKPRKADMTRSRAMPKPFIWRAAAKKHKRRVPLQRWRKYYPTVVTVAE
jgi:hypothetical protein